MRWTENFNPSVNKKWLTFLAGFMWSVVGLLLCRLAFIWLKPVELRVSAFLVASGFLLALIIFIFGFSRFARSNIQRIDKYPKDNICIFAFQQWTSYPLILVMISLGIFLREFSPIPKHFLSAVYIGIGGSLFLGSLLYYKHLVYNPATKSAK